MNINYNETLEIYIPIKDIPLVNEQIIPNKEIMVYNRMKYLIQDAIGNVIGTACYKFEVYNSVRKIAYFKLMWVRMKKSKVK